MSINVIWNKKKVSAEDRAKGEDYTGARYSKLGNALYKMYQLICKDYEGVHMDIHEEDWYYNNKKVYNDGAEMWYDDDGKWYLNNIDITKEIEYFQKYRTKLRPVKEAYLDQKIPGF